MLFDELPDLCGKAAAIHEIGAVEVCEDSWSMEVLAACVPFMSAREACCFRGI
jgi:hypothetical protein